MATTVARDSFARGEYKRFCGPDRTLLTDHRCDWCGQIRKRLFSYVWWSDDKREPMDDNGTWFCNLDCHRCYHD